ncbi:MAG: hypothetical protein WAU32_07710 [Thermoanaerobaculia bacterium]
MTRRRIAGAAAGLLLALILLGQSWEELPRRARFLAAYAPKELAVRRLGGSGTAFDRRYFSFLENARRRLPASAKGVVILGAPADENHVYLASYQLAPLPVAIGLPPERRPDGWIVAVLGPQPPRGLSVLARLPEGYLFSP